MPNGPLTVKLSVVTFAGADPELKVTVTFGFWPTQVAPLLGDVEATAAAAAGAGGVGGGGAGVDEPPPGVGFEPGVGDAAVGVGVGLGVAGVLGVAASPPQPTSATVKKAHKQSVRSGRIMDNSIGGRWEFRFAAANGCCLVSKYGQNSCPRHEAGERNGPG